MKLGFYGVCGRFFGLEESCVSEEKGVTVGLGAGGIGTAPGDAEGFEGGVFWTGRGCGVEAGGG